MVRSPTHLAAFFLHLSFVPDIISGAPGSGNTTLVHRVCKDLSSGRLRSGYSLVVMVGLRELIQHLQDKEEAQLHHFSEKFKHQVDTDQVCRELEKSY